ncbi:MAG: DNA repair protein RadA [Fibrobacterota bacterium]
MAKNKSVYVCTECGENLIKWMGRCPSCQNFNTIQEYRVGKNTQGRRISSKMLSDQQIGTRTRLKDYAGTAVVRQSTGFPEIDTVLGGGIVPGELCLIGGTPGIGKSTLLLQIGHLLSCADTEVLYVSGEESVEQISLRADRLGCAESEITVVCETSAEQILAIIEEVKPNFLIVDSIQTLYTESSDAAPGSVSQVRESTAVLSKVAKEQSISTFIIGHVTKDGSLSGPRLLEHMVDAVLQFEGDSNYSYRFLRSIKNRFGPAGEIAILGMEEKGLVELSEGARFFINNASLKKPGTAVVPILEGSRVLMVEVQALVTQSHFGLPQRVASGVNQRKLALIVAVLEKFAGISLGGYDIFVNITGGLTVNEPAVDLAVAVALVSSFKNKSFSHEVSFLGELGLSGEIRTVADMDKRIREVSAVGFKYIAAPAYEQKTSDRDIRIIACNDIAEMVDRLLG